MNRDDKRNKIAPTVKMSLKIRGSPALNLKTVRLRPASVPGRDAFTMGSTNPFSNSPPISTRPVCGFIRNVAVIFYNHGYNPCL